jgi:type II secretion system protein N
MAALALTPGLPIKNPWVRRLALPALFVAALVLFMRTTFPFEELARRIEAEVHDQGGELTIDRMRSSGFAGASALGVRLRLAGGPGGELGPEIKFDRVDVRIDLLPLLLRRIGFNYSFEGYGGKGSGHARLAKDSRQGLLEQLTVDATDLDLRLLPLRDSTAGLDVGGRLQAKVDLSSMSPPDQATGSAVLSIKGAAITGGKVMGATMPRTSLGDIDVSAALEKGVARLDKTVARGGDFDADAEGTVRLKPLLSLSQADIRVRFKPSDAWLNANPMFRGLLSAVGNARQPDGSYAFTLTGPLSNLTSRPGR